jgi:hypothetical protein
MMKKGDFLSSQGGSPRETFSLCPDNGEHDGGSFLIPPPKKSFGKFGKKT